MDQAVDPGRGPVRCERAASRGRIHRKLFVIAGYPWFGDWGRDTMIALRDCCSPPAVRKSPRGCCALMRGYVDRGMLPNRFPDAGEVPEYNTVDAALWFIEAVRQYYAATRDLALVREIFPALAQIIDEYTRGTRYNIHVDSSRWPAICGRAGRAAYLDGCQGGRLGGDAARGQARGGERALAKRARDPGEICGGAGRFCRHLCSPCRTSPPGLSALLEPGCKLLL